LIASTWSSSIDDVVNRASVRSVTWRVAEPIFTHEQRRRVDVACADLSTLHPRPRPEDRRAPESWNQNLEPTLAKA
jgi:hypothetical protein